MLASAAVMLTACHGSAGPDPVPLNPVVETRRELVTVCPADLAVAPTARPTPAAGAVVEFNAAGRDWLAAVIAWGEGLFDTLTDARADCPDAAGAG